MQSRLPSRLNIGKNCILLVIWIVISTIVCKSVDRSGFALKWGSGVVLGQCLVAAGFDAHCTSWISTKTPLVESVSLVDRHFSLWGWYVLATRRTKLMWLKVLLVTSRYVSICIERSAISHKFVGFECDVGRMHRTATSLVDLPIVAYLCE